MPSLVLPGQTSTTSLLPPSRATLLLLCAIFGWLWLSLFRQLSYEWSANEQYGYGWFVPFFAAFLFWLRMKEPAGGTGDPHPNDALGKTNSAPKASAVMERRYHPGCWIVSVFLLLLLLPLRLFEAANPDWRLLSWLHALLVVGLTLLFLYSLGGKRALRRFVFPVAFILVAVPWITPVEAPIVQGLMQLVAAAATETLTLFGIPVQLEGNLIHVSSGLVGISEACSGVRSLQTSLMIGLLFGELRRLSIGRRVALVGAAVAIALLANFGRALFLVWIATTRNLETVKEWHDFAGYAIVGAVFLGTVAIAAALGGAEKRERKVETRSASAPTSLRLHRRSFILSRSLPSLLSLIPPAALLLCIELSVAAWYRWHERHFILTPRWTVRWPINQPGFHEVPIADNIASTLRYDNGREATWRTSLTSKPNEQRIRAKLTLFFFRWDPGSASLLRARAHRPDVCLPNTGWHLLSDDGVRSYPVTADFSLPFRHFAFIHDAAAGRKIFANAFFCEREDRVPPALGSHFDATAGETGNWFRGDRLRVVRQGLRNQGQQVVELILLTPKEMTREAAEREFAQLVEKLIIKK